jgi:GDSL/SGNH-like Acyl-Esterase family found in Pmr5 and Cas1p
MMHAKTCRLISTTACFVVILSCVSAATGLQGGADDCFPFDPLDDRLDAGYWTFSTPNNLTSPDCQRHFHVETGTSSDGGTCALKRFGISAARECLRGKHIVMIGDSLMHHQFQSLILFLQTGQHPKAISRNPTPQIAEVTKSARQVTGCGLPWLRCDRPDVPNDPHPNIDNRYYYNAEFDVNVTLLGIYDFANGRSPVGWFPPSIPFDDGWEWKNGGIPRIAAVIQQTFGKVDEILVNVGVWGLPNVFPDKYRSQQHYMTGPIDDVIEELRTLEPLTRRVRDGLNEWNCT